MCSGISCLFKKALLMARLKDKVVFCICYILVLSTLYKCLFFSCSWPQRPHIFGAAWAKQAGSFSLLKALFESTIKNTLEALLTNQNFYLFNIIKITCHSSLDYQKRTVLQGQCICSFLKRDILCVCRNMPTQT